jgi:hypothetical protein
VNQFTCPVCHSDGNVAGNKVHDGHGWWHKCFNEHGTFSADEGTTFTPWPKPLYFTSSGNANTQLKGVGIVYVEHQEAAPVSALAP